MKIIAKAHTTGAHKQPVCKKGRVIAGLRDALVDFVGYEVNETIFLSLSLPLSRQKQAGSTVEHVHTNTKMGVVLVKTIPACPLIVGANCTNLYHATIASKQEYNRKTYQYAAGGAVVDQLADHVEVRHQRRLQDKRHVGCVEQLNGEPPFLAPVLLGLDLFPPPPRQRTRQQRKRSKS